MILVTGAAGFVGSHVVEGLLSRGQQVVGLDAFTDNYDPAIKRANLAAVALAHPKFNLVEANLCDRAALEALFAKFQPRKVIHLAAIPGVRPSVTDPLPYMTVNVGGTGLLFAVASAAKIERFVLASSSSVYGNRSRTPFHEDDPAIHPVSPYGASKRASELVAHSYHHLTGVATTVLRLFTVYGPRQRPEMAIHKFTRQLLEGQAVDLYGDGQSMRDYTFVSDVVDGLIAALDGPPGYEVINIGGSQPVSLTEVVSIVASACGASLQLRNVPFQAGDVEVTAADVARAAHLLGFRPKVALTEGVKRFVDWYRSRSAHATTGASTPGAGSR